MAHPGRNASAANILSPSRTFFATTGTSMGKRLLQSERNAGLLIEVLRSLVAERQFELHDFVIMPDHLHLVLTVHGGMTIERAMQLIKGGFSYRLSHEFDYKGEVWHRGFTEEQITNKVSFQKHRDYIAQNPVKAGLSVYSDEFPFCFRYLAKRKAETRIAGAKARDLRGEFYGPAEAVPLLQSPKRVESEWRELGKQAGMRAQSEARTHQDESSSPRVEV